MEIIFHEHHAEISERMRERARRAVRRVTRRMERVVDAIVRFEQDGPTRRVEIVLHAPKKRSMVAEGTARFFGPALAFAIGRLESQTRQLKRTPRTRSRKLARA